MTANGNSPLDNMRTLEHYLSDIMRAGAADTPEHLKGMSHIFLSSVQLRRRAISAKIVARMLTPLSQKCGKSLEVLHRNCRKLCSLFRVYSNQKYVNNSMKYENCYILTESSY